MKVYIWTIKVWVQSFFLYHSKNSHLRLDIMSWYFFICIYAPLRRFLDWLNGEYYITILHRSGFISQCWASLTENSVRLYGKSYNPIKEYIFNKLNKHLFFFIYSYASKNSIP